MATEGDDAQQAIPMGILLATKGTAGNRLLFLYPPSPSSSSAKSAETSSSTLVDSILKTDRDSRFKSCVPTTSSQLPVLMTIQNMKKSGEMSFPTQFILSTCMLANILSVRESAVNAPFELKVDNMRFAGHPKKLATTSEGSSTIFNIVFVLPASVDSHLVESFQERLMRSALDEFEAEVSSRPESDQSLLDIPWDTIRRKSALAELLTKVFLDVGRTGVVQVFVDNFIEVGFCVQSRAFAHAHLTPKNRAEIDRIVKRIRPYHGILLLEDVWPSPDANPSVTLLLKHCEPDRSILDMSTASGIPLLQVVCMVCGGVPPFAAQYLVLSDKRDTIIVKLGGDLFAELKLERAEEFVTKKLDLHRFCYIVLPFSDAKLPRAGHHCPDSLKMSRKEDEEVERFRTVVSEQLLGQFKEAHKDRQEILRELQEYASLLVVIRNMQNNKADKINIRASLGHQVFVNAELDKRDTIIVKLGGDLFAELKLERAEEFVTKKLDVLRTKADLCLELASKIEATMKFIMATVGEYDKLAAKR
ncbi:hypothetical protein GCK32_002736 [Trichostrongylus colubriformis]|uniref:Uncharacterized protein n=1 Tax=Trichostrongylus colubriformis TaxID=6319 RepID=A0AAN8EXC3_TRICO